MMYRVNTPAENYRLEPKDMEVDDGRCFSFSTGRFSGESILNFGGVTSKQYGREVPAWN